MFSGVFMGFGVFLIFRSKGGAKIFGRVAKGGRKISDASLGGGRKILDRRNFLNPWVKKMDT